MLFGTQFLNDFTSVNSKERQFGEELYSGEVKYQLSTLLQPSSHKGCPKQPNNGNNVLLEFKCLSTLLNPQVHKSLRVV
jgi:hypothetical protein